jgi:hypothetical protein
MGDSNGTFGGYVVTASETSAPNGRTSNPTAKAANDASSETRWFCDGKNTLPIVLAKNPYTVKSCHSIALPMEPAT